MKQHPFEKKLIRQTRGVVWMTALRRALFVFFFILAALYLVLMTAYFFPGALFFRLEPWGFILLLGGSPLAAWVLMVLLQREDMPNTLRRLEMQDSSLRDRLLTALETVRQKNPAFENPVSRALALSLREEMSTFLDQTGFRFLSSFRKTMFPLALILFLAAIGSVHAMVQPDFLPAAVGRLTRPLNSDDLLKTGLGVLKPQMEILVSPGDCEIPSGSSFEIEAWVKGYEPGEVQLYVKEENAAGWQMFPMNRLEKGHYQFLMTHVLRPSEYYIQADHQASKHFRISLYETLKIVRALWRLEFPKYMRVPEQRKEGWRDKMTVPQGTVLNLEIFFNRSPKQAWIVSDRLGKIRLEPAGKGAFRAALEIKEDQMLRLDIAGPNGESLSGVPPLQLVMISDLSPYLEVLEPQIQNYAFPTEEIPFVVSVNDDYGIRRVTLIIRHQAREERIELLPEGETPTEMTFKTVLPLEKFKLRSRGLVFAYLEVEDIYPGDDKHIVHSPLFTFLIRDYVEQFKMNQPDPLEPSLRMLFESILIGQEEIMQETWDFISRLPVENPKGWETSSEGEEPRKLPKTS